MYNEHDVPWTVLPGLYCSMPRSTFSRTRHRACAYLTEPNQWIRRKMDADTNLLFSFMGGQSDPIRKQLIELRHKRGYLLDTSHLHQQWGCRTGACRLRDTITRSKFVLCPRGRGPASYRRFRNAEGRRVPVIISEDWVAPRPRLDACSVRWPRRNTRYRVCSSCWNAMARMAESAARTGTTGSHLTCCSREDDDCGCCGAAAHPERWRRTCRPVLPDEAVQARQLGFDAVCPRPVRGN